MSASEANISVSLSPEPSADNYSRPFSRTQSHQSCLSAQLKPEELSAGPSQKRSTPRSGPVFNFTFDSSPPFFPLYHLSTPPARPTYTVPVEFHSRANLYFQDNQRLDTHSFPMLQSGWLNGNWWFSFWNETLESTLPTCPPHSCMGDHPATPSAPCYLRPGLLSAANFSSCTVWRRGWNGYCEVQLKKMTDFSQTPFLHANPLSWLNCRQTSKHLKLKGLFSALLPAGCCVAI